MKNQEKQNTIESEGIIPSSAQSKTAFYITPMGSENSEVRRSTNGVMRAVIEPVLQEHNLKLIAPHEIHDSGSITKLIISYILNADLVIANLTGLNPNVMYELAIRHAKRLPVIIISEFTTKIPFDVITEKVLFYNNDMEGVVLLKEQLAKAIPLALKDNNPSNPIYSVVAEELIQELVSKDGKPFEKFVINQLADLSEAVAFMKNNVAKQQSFSATTDSVPNLSRTYIAWFDSPVAHTDISKITDIVKQYIPDSAHVNGQGTADGMQLVHFSTSMRYFEDVVLKALRSSGFPVKSIIPSI